MKGISPAEEQGRAQRDPGLWRKMPEKGARITLLHRSLGKVTELGTLSC